MSTMYYAMPEKEPIGQRHSLGKDKGYHFTWCIFPLDFGMFYHQSRLLPLVAHTVRDEYGNELMLVEFIEVVRKATSQSFERGIAL